MLFALSVNSRCLIFNEDPDRVSKNLVLCSLHFTVDFFINKVQFNVGFSERLKLKDDAVPTILDLTGMSQSNCFYWSLLLCLFLQIVWYVLSYLCIFDLNHCSIHLWGMNVGCQTYTTISQSQQWAFTSSATLIQTERSDEGVKNRTEKAYSKLWCFLM